jgi:hypothetical protein
MEGRARGAPFCKNIFFVSRLVGREVEKNKENREKRGSCDSVAVQAHIVKRHFILIQSEQFFLHVIMCLLMNVFMCL